MENESNKTAIDQMFDIIEGLAEYNPENPMLQSLLAAKPRLKEVEKGQVIKAFNEGYRNAEKDSLAPELIKGNISLFSNAYDYFFKTYGGNK
jgi:hypothetical protein